MTAEEKDGEIRENDLPSWVIRTMREATNHSIV